MAAGLEILVKQILDDLMMIAWHGGEEMDCVVRWQDRDPALKWSALGMLKTLSEVSSHDKGLQHPACAITRDGGQNPAHRQIFQPIVD